ncbi:MAG: InlB B-repeat-containing protein [Candidatus Methylomirabilia bacterium]
MGDSSVVCVHPTPRSLVISSRPDLTLASPLGDRTIERTYRTGLVGDATAGDGMFGKGWHANFEYRIRWISSYGGIMLFDAAGRKVFYQRDYSTASEVYIPPDGSGGTVSKAADGTYLWQDAQGTSYQFDAAGNIQFIKDLYGNQERFAYSAGRISSLTDRHGRVVTFDYQGTNYVKRLLGPPIAANPAGVYASYAYDTNGNLVGVTYPDGNALLYGYENSTWRNHLTRFSFVGPLGPNLQRLFRYDAQGRVLAVSEGPEGRSYQLAYGSELVDFDQAHPQLGQKTLSHTTVTEWTDTNWDFQIDGGEVATAQHTYYYENRGGADVVTKIEDGGCSCAAEKTYDSAFHVVQSRDNKGVTSLMTYDDQGGLTSLTEAAGTADERVTGYVYDYAAAPIFPGQILQKTTRQQSVAAPGNDKLTMEINDPATGKLLVRREQGYRGDGSTLTAETVYSYTASGSVRTVDGPRPGDLDRITYDYYPAGDPAAGMLWKITEPNGAVTTFQQYDGLGNVLLETDANNRDTTFSFDSRGFLQARTTAEGTTRYEYDAQGNVAKTTYPKGNGVAYSHGQSGLVRVAAAAGRIDYGYANGNRISKAVYDANEVLEVSEAYDYDENNRLRRTRQANGDFEEQLYDENGNLTSKKLYSAAAPTVPYRTTIQEYDFLNRLTAISVAGDPYRVSYGYDAQGNLTTVTDPIDQATSYSYDDLGRQERVVSPETGTTDFTHDEAGNVVSRTDNLGRAISYAFDGLNRPTDIAYPDASPPVHYRYDDYSVGSYPDAVGRLTEVTDASGFRRFFYNVAGRPGKVVHAIDGREFTTEYGYDSNGNLSSLTYPDGRTVQYAFDPLTDRVQSVTSWKSGKRTVLAGAITHKPFGPMNGLDYGNGMRLARGYENLRYRLGSLAVTGPFGNPLPPRSYDYDPAGNIRGITRDLPDGPEPHLFEYDPMNRLSSWTSPGRSQAWAYDANGNRQSFSEDGLYTDYSYDPVARNILAGSSGVESLAFGSDLLGNITGWGSTSLAYDTDGRLAGVEDAGVPLAEYVYNSDGQRARKTAAGEVTYFEYDAGGRLLHEYRAGEEVSVDYVYLEGEPLAMLVSDKVPETYIVTPLAVANGSLTPSAAQTVEEGQTVAFVVTPDAGYHVAGVTGCGGTLAGGTYSTGPITEDCTVAASFAVNTYRLTTTHAGTGGGTVTSSPAGIAGDAGGSATYIHGTEVNLAQAPDAGSLFTGWGGDCSGAGACAVTMTADRTVVATFSQGITVSAPNGGEALKRNKSYTIRWSYLGKPGASVKIELLKSGELIKTIKKSASLGKRGSGSCKWKVPKSLVAGSDYSIRVTSRKSGSFTDTGDAYFTIY